ncbi:hypothetical protein LCGC14_1394790 [marine sediment metagenome]|uniref:Uncharacterized protein n=1 Tax=marine sediment metagenome TaxID=412755 RepID=A0A0F9JZ14_9ZZZZ
MLNPFKRFKDNPGHEAELPVEGEDPFAGRHGSLWKFLLKLDKRQAITDERVRFNTWIVSAVVGIELLILGYMIGT